MPASVGVRFAHAAVQALADDAGVDVLHIKGPAVDDRLLERRLEEDPETGVADEHVVPRISADADVLVRPSHVGLLVDAMRSHGWTTKFRFEDGSAFEHASTMVHEYVAPMDVHRSFPGIGLEPEAAFDRLWADRHGVPIAGYRCEVPSLPAQRALLLLHAARGGVGGNADVPRSWEAATATERAEIDALTSDLRAEVAIGAATGRLHLYTGRREHALWQALSSGESSLVRIWAARVRAEPTYADRYRTAVRLLRPNPRRLEQALGRRPTRGELVGAYVERGRRGIQELGRLLSRPRRRRNE